MSRHASLSNDITHQNTDFHWFLKSHNKRRYITFSLERWNFLLHTQHSRIFARLTRWQSPTNYCIVTRDNILLYSTKYWYAMVDNRRFSREVIAAMLVDKNKISHQLLLFVHQKSCISLLLWVSLELGWKRPIVTHCLPIICGWQSYFLMVCKVMSIHSCLSKNYRIYMIELVALGIDYR